MAHAAQRRPRERVRTLSRARGALLGVALAGSFVLLTGCTKPAREWLAEARQQDPYSRIVALNALGVEDTVAEEPVACIDVLLEACADEDEAIRREARRSLARLGPAIDEPIAELICRDPKREIAARELIGLRGERAAAATAIRFLDDHCPSKDVLARVLSQLGTPGQSALADGLASSNPSVVRAAVLGLGICGGRASALRDRIAAHRGSGDEELERRVAATLRKILEDR